MTPKEAVKKLVAKGVLLTTQRTLRAWTRRQFEAVATTAKEKATRRCADGVKRGCWQYRDCPHAMALVNGILTTGGLEAEE